MYAELIFPLPFRKAFTYSIPAELIPYAKFGVRAVAPFGKRTLTGFIINVSKTTSVKEEIKPIKDIVDEKPIIDKKKLKFYEWLSDYYLSSLGEALKLAVPYGSEIESKRKIYSSIDVCKHLLTKEKNKNFVRAKILNVLSEREEISQQHLQKLVKRKNIYSVLQTLQNQGAISVFDDVEKAKVKPKMVLFVKLEKSVGEIYSKLPALEKNQNSIRIIKRKRKGTSCCRTAS